MNNSPGTAEKSTTPELPSGVMIGTGEYTTGYVHNSASQSDKSAGVVALTLFDLRQRGKVGSLLMAGTDGSKFPFVRDHLKNRISDVYHHMDVGFTAFPENTSEPNPNAYIDALDSMRPGDFATIFTPDQTHFDIAMQAVTRGIHVLLAKPLVQSLRQHHTLLSEAEKTGALVALEVHKRWDPMYVDARDRIQNLGEFSSFSSYMSQPKSQLETFKHWAAESDISYYLNAHHIDFHAWCMQGRAIPVSVYATGATGVAHAMGLDTEDTISLHVTWKNIESESSAIATYTASWIAPPSDVHSQQRFHYMAQGGELHIDQARRGFQVSTDSTGYQSVNPLFMKYTPDHEGNFAGQSGYGYKSIEAFVDAVAKVNTGKCKPADLSSHLALAGDTLFVTAILEAGRLSLDSRKPINIELDASGLPIALTK